MSNFLGAYQNTSVSTRTYWNEYVVLVIASARKYECQISKLDALAKKIPPKIKS